MYSKVIAYKKYVLISFKLFLLELFVTHTNFLLETNFFFSSRKLNSYHHKQNFLPSPNCTITFFHIANGLQIYLAYELNRNLGTGLQIYLEN